MLKRLISFTALFFISTVLFAQAEKVVLGEAKEDIVNVRSGANINFDVISQLEKGEAVEIIGEQYDWYKIILPKSTTCYVSTQFLVLLADNELAEVITDKVNVRSRANLNCAILGQLNLGSVVKIKSRSSEFFEIDCPEEITGWVSKSLIENTNGAS